MDIRFPTPLVLCDIGGTNTRFAMVRAAGAPLERIKDVRTRDFPDFEAALEEALSDCDAEPKSLIACAAGPALGRTLALTNAPWRFDGAAIAARFALAQGLLLNDFEAQALALPIIGPDDALTIGEGWAPGPGPQLIMGPGTGLGLAALVQFDGRFLPLATEAGHVGFGPADAAEAAIWPHIERVQGRITAEALISGPGMERIHRARMSGKRLAQGEEEAPAITRAALADARSEAAETVRMLWRLVARFAGDMAIAFGATGGVTLAGGVLPRLTDLLDAAEFRDRFTAKAPVEALAQRIPTRLLRKPEIVLDGMAAVAVAPQGYALDYHARLWRA
jgi:glucokinase